MPKSAVRQDTCINDGSHRGWSSHYSFLTFAGLAHLITNPGASQADTYAGPYGSLRSPSLHKGGSKSSHLHTHRISLAQSLTYQGAVIGNVAALNYLSGASNNVRQVAPPSSIIATHHTTYIHRSSWASPEGAARAAMVSIDGHGRGFSPLEFRTPDPVYSPFTYQRGES